MNIQRKFLSVRIQEGRVFALFLVIFTFIEFPFMKRRWAGKGETGQRGSGSGRERETKKCAGVVNSSPEDHGTLVRGDKRFGGPKR